MTTPANTGGWQAGAQSQSTGSTQGQGPQVNVGGVSRPQNTNPFQLPTNQQGGLERNWGPGMPGYGVTYTPVNTSQQQATNEFQMWNDTELNNFRNYMSLLNTAYLTAPNYDTGQGISLQQAWTNYVSAAAQRSQALGKAVSPWDLISSDVQAANGGKGKGDRTVDKTTSQVNLTNRADAQAIFYQAAQQLLGRAPTDSEVANFQGVLNAQERANPIVTTKQITYNDQGFVTDTNVLKQKGGVSSNAAQMAAMKQAQENPEYGAFQAATTGMSWLQQALGGGGL